MVVRPTVLTVPMVNGVVPVWSRKLTAPVLPARVVMALPVLVRVKDPPGPKSSSPVAARSWDWVTTPVDCRVIFTAEVSPTVLTVPMA